MKNNRKYEEKSRKVKSGKKGTVGPRPVTDPATILDPRIRTILFGPVKQG